MAIIRAPLKNDPTGKCSRWRVILYNPASRKHEWHTVAGTKSDALKFERDNKTKIENRTYIAKKNRMTLKQVADSFIAECKVRNRRTSTLLNYKSVLEGHILPKFGTFEVGAIQKKEVRAWFALLLQTGKSAELVNRIIRVFKTVLFYALTDLEVLERNIMLRFKQYQTTEGNASRRTNRGAFAEAEVQALLSAARPHERALIGLLCFTGMRPGECYALRWQDVDLTAGSASVTRNWDWRGKKFTAPKTEAGARTVALSGWLVAELEAHKGRSDAKAEALIFATRTGQPMNPSNVRRDIWSKLIKRAGVRILDMYSLRHTFASLGRVAGEEAFNVARAMGHSRSILVDQVYAHSLQSGMASVAERVTARALGIEPKLRVIDGGKSNDVRQPSENQIKEQTNTAATA
jgi:integrase